MAEPIKMTSCFKNSSLKKFTEEMNRSIFARKHTLCHHQDKVRVFGGGGCMCMCVCYKLTWRCELITSSHSVSMKCPTKKHPGYCYFLFLPLNSSGRAKKKKLISKCQKWIDYTQFNPKNLSNQCTGPYFSHFMGQQGKLLRRANLQLCS